MRTHYEYLHGLGTRPNFAKLRDSYDRLSNKLTGLRDFAVGTPEAHKGLKDIYEGIQAAAKATRISKWKNRMNSDDTAARRWVKREAPEDKHPEGPIHPQARASDTAQQWKKIWMPPEVVSDEAVEQYLGNLRKPKTQCPESRVTPAGLHKAVA